MPVTLTGAEFKRFFKDPAIWGADDGSTWLEDEVLAVDGDDVDTDGEHFDYEKISDTAIVLIKSGYIENPPKDVSEDYVKAVRGWLRKQSMRQVLLDIPVDKLDEVLRAVKALGVKVVD